MGFLIECPICKGGFADGRAYTGTSGVMFVPPHPLYEFCDAGLHFDCLERWPHRLEFSRGYFEGHRAAFIHYGTLLASEPSWILGCGPAPIDKEPYYAEVDLADWPCRLYSRWHAWDSFLAGGYADGIVGEALIAAAQAIIRVREFVPDLSALGNLRHAMLRAHNV